MDDPKRLTAVTAIDRATDKKFPGKLDAATGRFTVEVPLGVTCDLLLDCGGTLLEGVNLKVPRSDFEEEQPLTKEDVEKLKETAKSLNKFEDMNYAEIAEVMGLTTKAVKSLLSRARENLRLALRDYIYMDSQTIPAAPNEEE